MPKTREGRPAGNEPTVSIPTENADTTVAARTDPRADPHLRRVAIADQDPAGLAAILDALADLAPPRAAARVRRLADQLAHAEDPDARAALREEDREHLAETWPLVMREHRAQAVKRERYVGRGVRYWTSHLDPGTRRPAELPDHARTELRKLYNTGLPFADLRVQMDEALDPGKRLRSPWRFFLSRSWALVRELRAEAEDRAGVEVERDPDGSGT